MPTSSLLPANWEYLLSSYPDKEFVRNIVGIATYSARIGYLGPFQSISSPNHSSATRIPSEIYANIHDELVEGRIKQVPHLPPHYICSPLGSTPKKSNGTLTGWRRIHDLSFPHSLSVNNGIPKHYGSLSYQTLDDAISLIAKAGPNVQLHKHDLKDAFRKIPVSPYDHWLLLFQWMGIYYTDLFLPFGLATAPFLFNLFAEALHWILEYIFSQSLIHYLDDFLLIGGNGNLFGELCNFLGFEEKSSKSIDGTIVDFTGIELDSCNMIARLPPDKHHRALNAVITMLERGSTNFITLRSTLGFLSFCARVIPLGRPFLRNLFNFLFIVSGTTKNRHTPRKLSANAKRDLKFWALFLSKWDGIRIICPHRRKFYIYTDASGSKGIGGWWGPNAFSSRMPRRHRSKHINWKEAYAILFALACWAEQLSGCSITFMCDNKTIVSALNNKSVHGEAINPLQLILLTAALYDIEIESLWLSSEENWIADALSRFNIKKLANFQLDKLFNLPRHQSGSPLSLLKKKLLGFYGTDLPQLQDLRTQAHETATNTFASSTDTPRHPSSRSPSNPSPTGFRNHSKRPNRRQLASISPLSKASTSISASIPQSSTILGSSVYYKEPFAYSEPNPSVTEERSRALSSLKCYKPLTPIDTTTQTLLLPSASPLQHSSDQPTSPGPNGTPRPTKLASRVALSPSQKTAFSSIYHDPKPTAWDSATPFCSHHRTMANVAPSRPSAISSTSIPFRATDHSSIGSPGPSTGNGLKHPYKRQSSSRVLTLPPTRATHSNEVLPIQQSMPASLHPTLKNLAGGNPTPSTDISPLSHHKNSFSMPTADFTWPPQHSNSSSHSVALLHKTPADEFSTCTETGPSSEDARPLPSSRLRWAADPTNSLALPSP